MAAGVSSGDHDEPMMDINTTPLIDVMLVLIIMLIITIPAQTHAVKIDLPQAANNLSFDPARNKIAIDQNEVIYWNGTPTDLGSLQTVLERANDAPTPPELQIQPHPEARYEIVDEVLAVIKRANVQAMGFVGNENYATDF